MFILYALIAGLAVGALAGGRLAALADLQFRWAPLILAGFLSQLVLFADPVASRIGSAGPALYVASTVAVALAVARNAALPGVRLVIAGAVCNLAAILANGGYMPADPGALASIGRTAPSIYSNSAVVASPALELFTDRFALPPWLPFTNVFSIGDVLVAAGVFVLVVVTMRASRMHPSGAGAPRQLPLSS